MSDPVPVSGDGDGLVGRPTPQDRRIAEIARASGAAVTGSDVEIADTVRRAWRDMNAFLGNVAQMFAPLAGFVEVFAELGNQPWDVEPVPDRSCHCLCPIHQRDGMWCTGDRDRMVTLVGGVIPRAEVPMCPPCGRWWSSHRPHRVETVREFTHG